MPPDDGHRARLIWSRHAVEREAVARLLPSDFEPAPQPDLTIEVKNMWNIGWLAGRGYSVVSVSAGVRWLGGAAPETGRFKLVLWENMADPIITGREELGYPKLFADIPDLVPDGDAFRGCAEWQGFRFLDLEVRALRSDPEIPAAEPSWHQAYMPRIGTVGEGREQTILTLPGQGPLRIRRRETGIGRATFHRATWQQLPTLCNVVNSLADADLGPCLSAGLLETEGATDLSGQLIVKE